MTTAAITAARTVQVLVIFALTIPLTQLLTKAQYGVYAHAVFLAVVVPFAFASAAGRTVAFLLPRAADPTRVLRLVGGGLGAALVMLGGAIAFVPEVLGALDPQDALLLEQRILIGAIVAASFPFAVAEPVMIARGRGRAFALVMLVVALVLLLGVGGALAFAPSDVRLTWALRGHLAGTSIQGAAGLAALAMPAARSSTGTGVRAVALRDLLALAAPLVAAALLGLLATRIDGFWIPRFFGEMKPEYLRGAMELPIVGALAYTVLHVAAPRLSRLDAAGERGALLDEWRRACRLIALVTIPLVGAVAVTADDLFLAIYPGYGNGVPVFRWYVLLLVIRLFLPATLMESTGAPRRSLAASAAHLVLAVVTVASFSAAWGWRGVAPAMFVSAIVAHWGVGGALARAHLRVRWSELLDWAWTGKALVVAAVCGGVSLALTGLDAAVGLHCGVRALLGGGVFLVALGGLSHVARLWSRADVERLREALRAR